MFNKKPKLREFPSGEDLYHKLTCNLIENKELEHTKYTIPKIIPKIPLEKYFIWSNNPSRIGISFMQKGVFLTKNKEVGLFELFDFTSPLFGQCHDMNFAYITNKGLKIRCHKSYLDFDGKKEIFKELDIYSLDLDIYYIEKMKLKRISEEVEGSQYRRLAQQLLQQKMAFDSKEEKIKCSIKKR